MSIEVEVEVSNSIISLYYNGYPRALAHSTMVDIVHRSIKLSIYEARYMWIAAVKIYVTSTY